ncbi:bifunctional glycosyltransferase/class I SAM-dependent methyltransferase [Butyrivibrio sp. YAB3001]|uniref:bifunctional glycosyltransferase/class I SAM-dependent methyltransferase n=1 Tax=Butyrivibrio sp. YAB3001 TaxID=1520812 RepID=UPI0008F68211|nr:bifunctional glycosyltransferase/class I SAM-dependent methyltransferase [Butyrivibrio sp. YAB3001]SFB94586.1 Glycosyl transferase family 2 [Butyrivibrio sp. YAB3001]
MDSIKEKVKNYLQNNMVKEAYEELSQCLHDEIAKLKDDVEYCIIAASVFMENGEYDKAFDLITIGLLRDHKNYELYLMLGEYYARINPEQALICFYHALYYCENSEDRNLIIEYIENEVSVGAEIRPVSFVIVSCDQSEQLKRCLNSIFDTVPKEVSEIIVVDNGSTDETRQWIGECSGITCVLNEENIGYTKAANKGIKMSNEGNDVLLLDADSFLIDNSFFYQMLGMYSDKRIGIVGAITNEFISDQKMPSGSDDLDEAIKAALTVNAPMRSSLEKISYVSDFAMLIKREVIDDIGVLNEKYLRGYLEDKDFCIRAHKAGYEVMLPFNVYIFKTMDRMEIYGISDEIIEEYKLIFKDEWGFNGEYSGRARNELLSFIEEDYNTPIRVLELGCAMGNTLNRIRRLWPNARVCGVEYDREVAEVGKTMLDIVQGDVETMDIPYQEGQFDYIICADVLEHLRDPQKTIERFMPYLKQNGHFIVSLPNIRNRTVIELLLIDGRFDYGDDGILDRTHLRFFTKDTAIEMLRRSGLEVEKIDRNYNNASEPAEFVEKISREFDVKDKDELRVFQYYFLCKRVI